MAAKIGMYINEIKRNSVEGQIKYMRSKAGHTCVDYRRNIDTMKELNRHPVMELI